MSISIRIIVTLGTLGLALALATVVVTIPIGSDLISIGEFHTAALRRSQDIESDLKGAVEESFAYIVSGHTVEQKSHQAQRAESLGRLAGGVAHDFNNVLQAILLGADMTIAAVESDPGAASPLLAELRGIETDAMRASVKQAGGLILVDSEPGKGTTFRIYLASRSG